MNTSNRRFASSLVLLVALWICGCISTEPPPTRVSADHVFLPAVSQDERSTVVPRVGTLTPEAQKRAEALAHYASGQLLFFRNNPDAAMAEWEKVVQLDPTQSSLLDTIIRSYLQKGEFKKAISALETSTRRTPLAVGPWSFLALAYRSDKQWDRAIATAEKAISLDPTQFMAYDILFDVAIEQDDLTRAKAILQRAAHQKSTDFRFWLRLADLSVALGTRDPTFSTPHDTIASYFDRAVALKPDDSSVILRAADFHAAGRTQGRAIELYQKILDIQPNADPVRIKMALCLAQGDRAKAIEVLEQVVKKEPLSYQIFTLIGEICEEMGDLKKAMTNYELSLSANPNQILPHQKIVMLQLRKKNYDEAAKQLALMQSKFFSTAPIQYFYGLAYSDLKNFPRALVAFEEAIRLSSSHPDLLNGVFRFHYGAALERAGKFDEAVEQFRKAIALKPDYADAYNYLGFMFADKNINILEAEQLIRTSLTYEPDNAAFLDSMGWVLYRQGKFDQALEYLQRAIQSGGNDAAILEHLGDVQDRMGHHAEALDAYRRAAELDPKNVEISRKHETLKQAVSSSSPISPSPSLPQSTHP